MTEVKRTCECNGCNLEGWSNTLVGGSYKFVCRTHYFMINCS